MQVKEYGVVVCKGKEGGRERGRENIEIINIDVLDQVMSIRLECICGIGGDWEWFLGWQGVLEVLSVMCCVDGEVGKWGRYIVMVLILKKKG